MSSAAIVDFSIICCHLQIVFSFRSNTVMAEQQFEEKKFVKGKAYIFFSAKIYKTLVD